MELARRLDDAGARAWPALEAEELGGWRMRASGGCTRRANSVLTTCYDDLPLPPRLTAVERFYAGRELPATYLLSPGSVPASLNSVLDVRGYRPTEPVLVQTRDLVDVPTGDALASRPSERWLRVWVAAAALDDGQAAAARQIIAHVTARSAYALLEVSGRAVAVGRGVLDGEWLGVFGMATLPTARQQGAARAVLERLLRWGRAGGATGAYLQVHSRNDAARRLYGRAGFVTAYRYLYRTR